MRITYILALKHKKAQAKLTIFGKILVAVAIIFLLRGKLGLKLSWMSLMSFYRTHENSSSGLCVGFSKQL